MQYEINQDFDKFLFISVAYQVKAASSSLFNFHHVNGLVLTMSLMVMLSSISTSLLYLLNPSNRQHSLCLSKLQNGDLRR